MIYMHPDSWNEPCEMMTSYLARWWTWWHLIWQTCGRCHMTLTLKNHTWLLQGLSMSLHELCCSMRSWLVERVSSRGVGPKMNNDKKHLVVWVDWRLIGVWVIWVRDKPSGKRLENCFGRRKWPLLETKLIFQGAHFPLPWLLEQEHILVHYITCTYMATINHLKDPQVRNQCYMTCFISRSKGS